MKPAKTLRLRNDDSDVTFTLVGEDGEEMTYRANLAKAIVAQGLLQDAVDCALACSLRAKE